MENKTNTSISALSPDLQTHLLQLLNKESALALSGASKSWRQRFTDGLLRKNSHFAIVKPINLDKHLTSDEKDISQLVDHLNAHPSYMRFHFSCSETTPLQQFPALIKRLTEGKLVHRVTHFSFTLLPSQNVDLTLLPATTQFLSFSKTNLDHDKITVLPKQLKTLRLENCQLGTITTIPEGLTQIHLRNVHPTDDQTLRTLLARVKHLSLDSYTMNDLALLPAILESCTLENVELKQCGPLPETLKALTMKSCSITTLLNGLPNGLETLEIFRLSTNNIPVPVNKLPKNLKHFCLQYTLIHGELRELPHSLKRLVFMPSNKAKPLSSSEIEQLPPQLEYINLSGMPMEEQAVIALEKRQTQKSFADKVQNSLTTPDRLSTKM